MRPISLLLVPLVTAPLAAQAGDRKDPEGMVQDPPPAWMDIPAAPARSAEEELATFRIADGFRIELVASEPLVEDPIAIAFDAASRMWVVEMRGYMPNADGEGEKEPAGRIKVLEDTDQDGRMDRATVYADGLALPRAVLPLGGGEALILAPPHFWHHRDVDGDLVSDTAEIVGGTFDNGFTDPEHAANTPTFGLDGWIHFARYDQRARYDGSAWTWEPVAGGGQWGLSRDDLGRWLFNTNSDHLRGHHAAPKYAARHPGLRGAAFVNQRIGPSQDVWPDRITPGVNRGYRKGTLRAEGERRGTLARFTAVCGPGVYRGNLMPDLVGDVLIPEPAAHLVRRERVTAVGTELRGANVYADEQREWWTSQDERFRPVNALTGPDGALYVVDMYRGVLQHRNYLTTYLRRQVEERGLELPIHLGRIWRVVPADLPVERRVAWPDLEAASAVELAAAMSSPNGVVRDLAQREVVRRGTRDAAPVLRTIVADDPAALPVPVDARFGIVPGARIQALWTLLQLDALDATTRYRALVDADPGVRRHALAAGEPRLSGADVDRLLLGRVLGRVDAEAEPTVVLQLALTLGEVSRADAFARERAERALATLLARHAGDPRIRDAVLTGLAGDEPRFLDALAADPAWESPADAARAAVRRLADAAFRAGDPAVRLALLERVRDETAAWRREAVLAGIVDALPRKGARPVELVGDAALVDALAANGGDAVAPAIARLRDGIVFGAAPEVAPLTAAQQQAFDHGRALYATHCQQCHQPSGEGMRGLAPPLRGSEWVLGDPQRLAQIVLHGLTGPIEVAGEQYDFPTMPDHGAMADADLAAILTYVRRGWDHVADPVEAALVGEVRAAHRGRGQPWTAAELAER